MLSFAAICQKGGVFKTGLMTNLATFAATRERDALRSLVIDMDPQGSALRFGQRRQKINKRAPVVRFEEALSAAAVQRLLEEAPGDGVGAVFIDTPQGAGDVHFEAVSGADLILVPVIPSFVDGNAALLTLIRAAKEGCAPWVVFTDCEVADKKPEEGDVADAVKGLLLAARRRGLPEPQICPHRLHHHVEFRHAAAEGLGVTEFAPRVGAGREMKKLAEWALEKAVAAHAQARQASTPVSLFERRAQLRGAAQ